jgi:transcriptional regulator with XRE-family HTH domain
VPTNDDAPRPNRFGAYLRDRRVAAGLSLRDVAQRLGISHVYLGEVERGVRGPLRPEHWSALLKTIPQLSPAELERAAAASRPMQVDLADAPAAYQDVALALARRFKRRDLSEPEITRLLKLLGGRRE